VFGQTITVRQCTQLSRLRVLGEAKDDVLARHAHIVHRIERPSWSDLRPILS